MEDYRTSPSCDKSPSLEPSKGSMRGKLKQAEWNNSFLVQILFQFANHQIR